MTAIQDFAVEATRRYIQSVVFVDDEIFVAASGKVAPEVKLSGMNIFRKDSSTTSATMVKEREEAAASEPTSFHPKQLVESFARQGVVCALYEPVEGFATEPASEIFKLCERADVVILDWDLYNQDGRNILPLLVNLVTQSQTSVPHHVRLCAIYSTKPDLFRISGQIFEVLKKAGREVEALDQNKLAAGSSRIVVLGKPSTGRPDEQVKLAQVSESDLADRIIREFAQMHEGILPSIALHGMAAVRSSSKKILDKFGADMDGAFLVHRAMIHPADDAFEQIPELLAEEALSVMLDNPVPPELTARLSAEAVDARNIQLPWTPKEGQANAGEIANDVMKSGQKAAARFRGDKQKNWVDELHDAMGAKATAADKRLASLYNTRTKYTGRRDLSFGTVARHKVGEVFEYLLCLMPLCDSVRLTNGESYDFPFWTLKTSNSGALARGFVVEHPIEKDHIELFALGKPRDRFSIRKFAAGAHGTVEAVANGGAQIFGEGEGSLEWVAQLKPSHAQRIAQDVGASFSRIGLIEAEWLRKKTE
ncbi:hypothetical protein GHK45_22360 [Sinorhizobium meliloti]|uniref:Response receiver domain-containing protein n=1 Tax=Rhizobium meliloti TaxID=382 RepID=A0A6A7ZW32_RHIML|nr:response regulator receiver domain [Sinorhizobium meliloti]MQW06368.1 hypothetical protein [Sinorhizobium meliloti]